MARERPAIVQRPLHAAAVRCQPFEKHLDVHIVPVDVVQMHHIGVDLVKPSEEPPRGTARMKPGATVEARPQNIAVEPEVGAELQLALALGRAPPAPANVRIDALVEKLSVQPHHDGARRTVGNAVHLHALQGFVQPFRHTILSTMLV